ncbi:hypothetical protein Q7C36_002880 [Tachysurus vachellii]|uniref:Uncharacterized protein n=1 Tax=Tachysurus vachellii TaxID=175792 RepID=A0AA88NSH0_TACVA|nr:hypothetical protein Q7C36_015317 [Tachysurus vachellii]KAK2836435.1 hypothetical protein Q7C36_014304 [Tachysurus vachellii]KAK2863726.1 hypothetical protein Q7C36_002880 [Tachysurus vachellii]
MATRYVFDPQNPQYQEGRRMVLEMELDRLTAESKRAALERKRAGSGGEPPRTSKRVFRGVGRGKPRGRRGGQRKASATVTYPPVECSLSSSVEVPSEILNPQEEFGK